MEERLSKREQRLAQALAVIGSQVRLQLLRELRRPRTITEIRLNATEGSRGEGGAGRPLARQTVREHLDKLIDLGLVVSQETERAQGPTVEYALNHAAVFALAEEVRGLARLRPLHDLTIETIDGQAATLPPEPEPPCMVLVHGLEEGRWFSLDAAPGARWTIGRRRGLHLPLDFDPYVSGEHACIDHSSAGYEIVDLDTNRNGTMVNFRRLAPGASRPLMTGDLVGVGRSLLLFIGPR